MNKIPAFILGGALFLGVALPVTVFAQQQPPAPTQSAAPHHHGHHGGMMRAMRNLNLSDQQRTQIRQIVSQYRAAHPKGSPRDPQAAKAMRQQVMNVLTPAQRTQFQQNVQQMRARYQRPQARPSP
jgi:Spy/CpxP family protein refolding chaperone